MATAPTHLAKLVSLWLAMPNGPITPHQDMALHALIDEHAKVVAAPVAMVMSLKTLPTIVVALVVGAQVLDHLAHALDESPPLIVALAAEHLLGAIMQAMLIPLRARARLPRLAAEIAELRFTTATIAFVRNERHGYFDRLISLEQCTHVM